MLRRSLPLLAALLATAPATLLADSHNPSDYPLRIHIFTRNETTFYHMRSTDEAKGEGRADLFENGQPKGLDFQFDCTYRLMNSSGYETFPAKWKKPGDELIILQPVFGKPGNYNSCHLKVMIKDFVYVKHNGSLVTEPATKFKEWMTKHDYDPEHGKDLPSVPEAKEDGQ
ncbi:hypothetical protein [Silvibacterium sp.]|uniref:hypothetical protein n=1 Tax=Silvibacterium sp. TaxID=1964179 RepID=UPI0039E5E630